MCSDVAAGAGSVLAGACEGSSRIFRVVVCEACHWQYGAYWPLQPKYSFWGDCPRCGHATRIATCYQWTGVRQLESEKQGKLSFDEPVR